MVLSIFKFYKNKYVVLICIKYIRIHTMLFEVHNIENMFELKELF